MSVRGGRGGHKTPRRPAPSFRSLLIRLSPLWPGLFFPHTHTKRSPSSFPLQYLLLVTHTYVVVQVFLYSATLALSHTHEIRAKKHWHHAIKMGLLNGWATKCACKVLSPYQFHMLPQNFTVVGKFWGETIFLVTPNG